VQDDRTPSLQEDQRMIRVPDAVRREVVQVCQRLYQRGLVAGTDGNVSVRVSSNQLLATPAGMSKGFLQADDLVVCDMQGQQLQGKHRLTTEIKIHLAAYAQREDVCAVVHAHPPYATAFAVANKTMDERIMPEAYITVGKVALAAYGTPSTQELEESIRPAVAEHDAILLANHGAMTFGRDVTGAYHRMEALEQLAHISALAQLVGEARSLSADEIARLEAIRGVYGSVDKNVPCLQCGWEPRKGVHASTAPDRLPTGAAERATGNVVGSTVIARPGTPGPVNPTGYSDPGVHWPGNPPVWERRGASATESYVRDLTRRTLREVRDGESRT
jgi:L-fuculose-phosphate aldolase